MKGMEIPSEEEMQGQVYQIYYDVLNEALQEGIRYGDKKKLKLHVERERTEHMRSGKKTAGSWINFW